MKLDVSIAWDKEKLEAERIKNPGVKAAAAGDLDGDGIEEMVVGKDTVWRY